MVMANDGTENLERADFQGEWHSDWTAFNDETQVLIINNDLSSSFTRKSKDHNGKSITAKSTSAEINQDLLILVFGSGSMLNSKLVLSGWKLEHMKKLYGTLYMYRDGKQFNGVPVSFVIDNE